MAVPTVCHCDVVYQITLYTGVHIHMIVSMSAMVHLNSLIRPIPTVCCDRLCLLLRIASTHPLLPLVFLFYVIMLLMMIAVVVVVCIVVSAANWVRMCMMGVFVQYFSVLLCMRTMVMHRHNVLTNSNLFGMFIYMDSISFLLLFSCFCLVIII
jgi:hypothetical protein